MVTILIYLEGREILFFSISIVINVAIEYCLDGILSSAQ